MGGVGEGPFSILKGAGLRQSHVRGTFTLLLHTSSSCWLFVSMACRREFPVRSTAGGPPLLNYVETPPPVGFRTLVAIKCEVKKVARNYYRPCTHSCAIQCTMHHAERTLATRCTRKDSLGGTNRQEIKKKAFTKQKTAGTFHLLLYTTFTYTNIGYSSPSKASCLMESLYEDAD